MSNGLATTGPIGAQLGEPLPAGGADDDDRDPGPRRAEQLGDVAAVPVGEHDVDDEEMRKRELHQVAELDDPGAGDDGEAQIAEHVSLEGGDVDIVLEDVGPHRPVLLGWLGRRDGGGGWQLVAHDEEHDPQARGARQWADRTAAGVLPRYLCLVAARLPGRCTMLARTNRGRHGGPARMRRRTRRASTLMARSMWRGAIQFGLVTIPVKLYLATETSSIGFNLLHASCLNRIQMKIYCPYHDEVIPRSETVRGYEWSKGKYVVVTDEDIDAVPLKTMRAIEIEMFVNASRDNAGTQFVKQAYYLEPDAIGAKAFYLLKSVLAEEGKSAICKIVLKDREQLAALNPFNSTMLLTTLHWPDEVRALEELNLPEAEIDIKPAERKMAEQLVASMTGDFSADDYRDEYRQALMAVIERKVGGEQPVAAEKTEPTKITDLMAALEASVAAARETRRTTAEKPAATEAEAPVKPARRRKTA